MPRDHDPPAKYRQDKVEAVLFDIALEKRRIATDALIASVVGDSDDEREMRIARQALNSLQEHGLLTPEWEDGTLEPTPQGVKAASLGI